uniref:Zinc finger C2H2 LYAR-type domain-containing protein n=1 Tax=Glossina morsitans morsitans TaxID=37546 RepID=A0A1B0G8Y6_GLOMM
MVFFICNHCGESVKKAAVEKHYNTKCNKRAKNVCCMDCQKDFRGEDYVAHTKCITEAEKYSGKDYVRKENNGEKKQDAWMDIVRSILASTDYELSAPTREIFQRLENYENVPRKKAKFQNFVANCMRISVKNAEPVWEILEKELEKMKEAKQQELAATKAAATVNNKQNKNVKGEADAKKETDSEMKHPVLKEALAKENGASTKEHTAEKIMKREQPDKRNMNDSQKPVGKNKKKGKQNAKNPPDVKQPVHGNGNKNQQGPVEKKKNKRKLDANGKNPLEGVSPKEENANANQEPVIKKKKQEVQESNNQNPDAVDAETTAYKEAFQWTATLEKIVAKHRKDGIFVETLKSQLLKDYKAKFLIEDLNAKQEKKFDKRFKKYLNKCPAIQVEGGKAKPC